MSNNGIKQADAFVVKTKDGNEARIVKTTKRLSIADGTLVKSKGIGTIVTALGYSAVGAANGGLVHRPQTVIANDREQPNGYLDTETGDRYSRTMFASRTGMGQMFITDRTVIFNAGEKVLEDYLSKAQYCPDQCKIIPKGAKTPGDNWARFALNIGIDLIMDTSDREVIKWMLDEKRTTNFAARKIQTMSERNAIKAHPAIIIPGLKDLGSTVDVLCKCWCGRNGPLSLDESVFRVDMSKILLPEHSESGEPVAPIIDAQVVEQGDLADDDHTGSDDVEDLPVDDATTGPDLMAQRTDNKNKLRAISESKPKTFEKVCVSVGAETDLDTWTEEQLVTGVSLIRAS